MDDRSPDRRRHERCVRAWLDDVVDARATASTLAAVILGGIHAVCLRSRAAMGEITLAAIFERVVDTGSQSYPQLSRIDLRMRDDSRTIACDPIDMGIADEVARGLEFVLVELLTVLGRLTCNALTPGVHSELRRTTVADLVARAEVVQATYLDGEER